MLNRLNRTVDTGVQFPVAVSEVLFLTLQPVFLQIQDLPTWALWTLQSEQFSVAVTVLCILRSLAASLAPTHQMSVAPLKL